MQTGILFIARIFPLLDQGQKNITQLWKYLGMLYAKPTCKVYVYVYKIKQICISKTKEPQ